MASRSTSSRSTSSRSTSLRVADGHRWPVVVLAAVAVTAILGSLVLHRSGLLGALLPLGYLVACLVGVMAVSPRSMAIPAVAPPVVAFLGLAITAVVTGDAGSAALFLLGVFAPLGELFWWILGTTLGCLMLAFLRSRGTVGGRR